ncbi:MAG: hypothetical protein HY735_10500 [Verrucomicrobia bacterium]|nr:hypothetical protein [Verrucomicrobiota bacterium]
MHRCLPLSNEPQLRSRRGNEADRIKSEIGTTAVLPELEPGGVELLQPQETAKLLECGRSIAALAEELPIKSCGQSGFRKPWESGDQSHALQTLPRQGQGLLQTVRHGRVRGQQGNTLLVLLVTLGVIGTALASYLTLVSNQNLSTMRSAQWNYGIAVAEAGVEEALTHLYYSPVDRATNGWVLENGYYTKKRALGDAEYVTRISTANSPEIISSANVRVPFGTEYIDPPRTVRVTTTNDALFAKGMVAKGQIDLSGNNIKTDSFDSTDPIYSTNGRYDPAKSKDNGDVATNSSLIDSLDVWNAEIYGKASTGPGGTVLVGPNGSVGSAAWHQSGNKGIEPGWANDDMNVSFPDVQPPFAGGASTPIGGTSGGTNYIYILTNGNWELASLSLSGQNKVLVLGQAVLYVTGNISLSGQSYIYVSTNSSLRLYVGGPTASIGGSGVMNTPGNATNFYYYGLPGNTSLSFSGNAAFTGAIYAPNAAFSLGGGGSTTYDFVGASVTSSVQMNGHFNFHYDENLGKNGPRRGFTIMSWNEI